ncbi:MAG: peptidoglycan DD-metalloendopeptidase family protein [Pseudomonadota bacterium]
MHRNSSPLMHDYKAKQPDSPTKSRPLRWFVTGLGIPLLASALFLTLTRPSDEPIEAVAENPAPIDTAADVTLPSEISELPVAGAPSVDDAVRAAEAAVFSSELDVAPEPAAPPPAFHPPLVFEVVEHESVLVTIQRGDTLDRIFRKHGIDPGDLVQIAKLPEASEHLRMLKPGDEIEIRHVDGDLMSLHRNLELTRALRVVRGDGEFLASIEDRPVETRRRAAYGRIQTSLFESGATAGLSDKMIMNLAGIFAWDVDFVLDIRTDDNYYILYEELWQDGELASEGEIVAAEFHNNGRTYTAIRYIDKEGRADYFTPEGHSVRKAFVRAPVDFTRISSSFNPRRRHPILNTIRAHRGVDYAAPRGTPVKAAGDGKVIFRGVKGGYGNTVILQHGGNITTLYAHLNAFDRKAGMGKRVKQGQTIAYVGATGLATAAHLHYEYRLNGVHRNPRTVKLPQAAPIKPELMSDFQASTAPILAELERFKKTRLASASAD